MLQYRSQSPCILLCSLLYVWELKAVKSLGYWHFENYMIWNWHCPDVCYRRACWWGINFGSGNGLVPLGHKQLSEPTLSKSMTASWGLSEFQETVIKWSHLVTGNRTICWGGYNSALQSISVSCLPLYCFMWWNDNIRNMWGSFTNYTWYVLYCVFFCKHWLAGHHFVPPGWPNLCFTFAQQGNGIVSHSIQVYFYLTILFVLVTYSQVIIGPGNGLLPERTKPLPELMLIYPLSDSFQFIWGKFDKMYFSSHQSLKLSWELNIQNVIEIFPGTVN